MNAPLTNPSRLLLARRRETATEKMIRSIDEKIVRLSSARRDRAVALQKIRCELARATMAGQVALDVHEHVH